MVKLKCLDKILMRMLVMYMYTKHFILWSNCLKCLDKIYTVFKSPEKLGCLSPSLESLKKMAVWAKVLKSLGISRGITDHL